MSLTWLSSDSQILPPQLPNFGSPDTWFHKFSIPDLRSFKIPDLHRFKIPDLRRFMTPDLRRFMIPNLRRFTIPDLRRFMTPYIHRFDHPATDSRFTRNSQIQLLFSHIIWKLISWNPANPTFRGCKVFPEFPNTSLSGKRVDSDDPIPRNFWILVKTSPSGRRSGHTSSGNFATV
jgi:hypothetical protein